MMRCILLPVFFFSCVIGKSEIDSIDKIANAQQELQAAIEDPSLYDDYLARLIARLPETPVDDSRDSRILSGTRLPDNFSEAFEQKGDERYFSQLNEAEKILSGELIALAADQMVAWADGQPERFVEPLLSRKDRLPPSRGDLLLFSTFAMLASEMNYRTLGAPQALWKELSVAKNPAYRIMAIMGYTYSVPSDYHSYKERNNPPGDQRLPFWLAEDRIEFLAQFLEETDPLLLNILYRMFSRTPHPKALFILEDQSSREVVAQNDLLRETLLSSQRSIELQLTYPGYAESLASKPALNKFDGSASEVSAGVTAGLEGSVVEKISNDAPAKPTSTDGLADKEPSSARGFWFLGAFCLAACMAYVIWRVFFK